MSGIRARIRLLGPVEIEVEISGLDEPIAGSEESGSESDNGDAIAESDQAGAASESDEAGAVAESDAAAIGESASPDPLAPLDELTGPLLRRRRRALGLSLARLGKLAGVTPKTLQNIESGRHRPTWDTLRRICSVAELRFASPESE